MVLSSLDNPFRVVTVSSWDMLVYRQVLIVLMIVFGFLWHSLGTLLDQRHIFLEFFVVLEDTWLALVLRPHSCQRGGCRKSLWPSMQCLSFYGL